jgi:hypothetical protein
MVSSLRIRKPGAMGYLVLLALALALSAVYGRAVVMGA